MTTLQGAILTTEGFVRGAIAFDARGRIANIDGVKIAADTVRALNVPIMLPGFIDLHVHGGGGRDVMEGGDAIARIRRTHAEHGTTALLATTMTAPAEDLTRAFEGLQQYRNTAAGGAHVLGVHLEGPYINNAMLGAQPDFARPASAQELTALHAMAPIRLITLAPEVPGNMEMIEGLCAAGYQVQIGHSAGSYDDGVAALRHGARGFTHLFNAMTGMHHRKPGMVGAALAHAEYAEIIPDLLHVHAGAIRVALRSIPRLFCVTDSTSATGMPDGEYRLGRHMVTKCLGGVRLADGTLAGSTLTMDQALKNLVDTLGLSIEEASRRTATNAADYLGIADRGRLVKDAWADVVVLDRDLNCRQVYVEGKIV
jgi:N-acetylglucosamine-6-phosphate deacetylase